MEAVTGVLTSDQFDQEISKIIDFLKVKGKLNLSVSYGWGCDLDMADLYQKMPLPLSELRDFITHSAQTGIFTRGESNLYISSDDGEIGFRLCDESDIHVTSLNDELVQGVASGWAERGHSYQKAAGKQEP